MLAIKDIGDWIQGIVVLIIIAGSALSGLAKAISENVERFRKIHASLQPYEASFGPTQTAVPLHPGAEKYYREKGYVK